MDDHTPVQLEIQFPTVKLCECGCGLPAPIATYHHPSQGYIKGQPVRFIRGHAKRGKSPITLTTAEPNPSGMCLCGCGNPAPIAKDTNLRKGIIGGKPVRFIHGHRIPRSAEDRFWEKVDKSGGPDACWIWIGSRNKAGYGDFRTDGGTHLAHRHSWEFAFGPIPPGDSNDERHKICVLHKCDNGSGGCVNPAHLFLGTRADNSRDMVEKGRNQKGESRHNAKLSNSEILQIRERHSAGEQGKVLALEFGVSPATISVVVNRKVWKHVE